MKVSYEEWKNKPENKMSITRIFFEKDLKLTKEDTEKYLEQLQYYFYFISKK